MKYIGAHVSAAGGVETRPPMHTGSGPRLRPFHEEPAPVVAAPLTAAQIDAFRTLRSIRVYTRADPAPRLVSD